MKRKFFYLTIFFFFSLVFAENTSFQGLYRYKLENGLELFVAENNSAPLVYIEIAVRAGAITQTPQNAGLFHLYEHMMFKGNAKYENQDAFTDAANEMGRIGENGTTGIDRVNYFFTVPSSQLRNGLEFWSYAVRTPRLDAHELENEKSVVLSEINADFTDPGHIRSAAIFKTMFPSCPWMLDPSGSPSVIRSATPEDLREIQRRYYIPANSAIFVGGDVRHDEVYSFVKEIYSDWKNPEHPVSSEFSPDKNPLPYDKKMVFVNPGSSGDMIEAAYYLRGPDGELDADDTYAADVWISLMGSPSSVFARTFTSEKALSIPESDYVSVSYPTRRLTGLLGFYGLMLNDSDSRPETNFAFGNFDIFDNESLNTVEKADYFLEVFKEKAVPRMTDKNILFDGQEISSVIRLLEDSRIYELESAKSILASLSYFWSTCGPDYFFTYDKNISNVSEDDVVAFVEKYIKNRSGAFVVSVSPGIWEEYGNLFLDSGYERISAENAFWQNDMN